MPLNNVTTANGYTTPNTLVCPDARRINIDVANAAIFYQLGHGFPAVRWDDELFMGPAFRSMDALSDSEPIADAIRVRSAVAGMPAQVTVHAR